MAKIINLNSVRKRQTGAEHSAKADENAARHGQSKASRSLQAAKSDKAARDLDGHKRDE